MTALALAAFAAGAMVGLGIGYWLFREPV